MLRFMEEKEENNFSDAPSFHFPVFLFKHNLASNNFIASKPKKKKQRTPPSVRVYMMEEIKVRSAITNLFLGKKKRCPSQ